MKDTIETIDQLEALYSAPASTSLEKVSNRLTPEYVKLIESSPVCLIASRGSGGLDCSPRGDEAQCIDVLDEQTIVIPDWRGNNRLDTLRNIIATRELALCLLIPGVNETVRINGSAFISVDETLLTRYQRIAGNGKSVRPATVIVINIKEVYFHCARAFIRSDLWNAEKHVHRSELPTAGQLVKSVVREFDAESYDGALPGRQQKTLY